MKIARALPLLACLATPALSQAQVDGLDTITPEWHAAIDAGQCLTDTGFGPCTAADTLAPAANGHTYRGTTVDSSRLLTRFNIYSEECRGAVGQANIDGWCARRDAARDALAAQGVCLTDAGFRSCVVRQTADLAIFGTWDCDGSPMTIDADSYQGKPIASIEESGGDYLITLTDGYRFATFEVTPTSFLWHSPQSGDSFLCRKQ